MSKRILIYATIYGLIGITIGVCMAIYTQDDEAGTAKTILLDRMPKKTVPEPTPKRTHPENKTEEMKNE